MQSQAQSQMQPQSTEAAQQQDMPPELPTEEAEQQSYISDEEILNYVKQNNPELYAELSNMSPEDRARVLGMVRSNESDYPQNTEMKGDLQ